MLKARHIGEPINNTGSSSRTRWSNLFHSLLITHVPACRTIYEVALEAHADGCVIDFEVRRCQPSETRQLA